MTIIEDFMYSDIICFYFGMYFPAASFGPDAHVHRWDRVLAIPFRSTLKRLESILRRLAPWWSRETLRYCILIIVELAATAAGDGRRRQQRHS